ncbi:hypothetical protein ACJX0J_014062, partial [Zea mays]
MDDVDSDVEESDSEDDSGEEGEKIESKEGSSPNIRLNVLLYLFYYPHLILVVKKNECVSAYCLIASRRPSTLVAFVLVVFLETVAAGGQIKSPTQNQQCILSRDIERL